MLGEPREGRVELPAGVEVVALDAEAVAPPPAGLPAARPGDLAYVMYTSGSTGVPKGVRVEQRSVVRLVRETTYATFGPERVFLHFAPLSFDASTFEIWGALLNGGRLVVVPEGPASLEDLGAAVRDEGVTTAWLTAGLFHQMVDTRLSDLRGLRELLAGGDVLSPAHVRRVLEGLPGCRVINGYGPTENTTFTCCHALERADDVGATVPIGRPIANTSVYVLDQRLEPVPAGVAGELYTGGDGVARDYLGRPDLTAERFVPDPFAEQAGARLYRTGDFVRFRADGTLEFLGRRDAQVKVRGFRIELGEVEAALAQHPLVATCAVVAREYAGGDKRLVGYVVARPGQEPSPAELREFLEQRLPAYMRPGALVLLEELPLTPNGKVDRRALPAPEAEQSQPGAGHAAPRTPLEETLAHVFAEVLDVPRVGVDESFFELGGHSLLLPRLTEQLERRLGRRVPLARIYAAPTVEALAETLQSSAPASPLLVPFEFPAHGPTFFCVHPGGGGASVYQDLARHLAPDVRLVGVQAVGLTGDEAPLRSIESMARRYVDALREAQPEGPYHLGGWSFGGLVAFEMAAQLTQAGAQVATLALIDTLPPRAIPPREIDPRVFMALFARLAGLELHERDLAAFEREEALAHVAQAVVSFTPSFGTAVEVARLLTRVVAITEIALSAVQRFEPRPWHGTGCVLLQAENQGELAVTAEQRAGAYGWPALVPGGLAVERLPGSHETVVGEPHVRALARALRGAVTRQAAASGRPLWLQ